MLRQWMAWGTVGVMAFSIGCTSGGPPPTAEPVTKPDVAAPAGAYPAPIVIEAEDFKANIKKGDHSWVQVTKPEGFSGKGAMQAVPNTEDVIIEMDDIENSPRLDYEVDFPKAGTYIVWVRGWGETQEDNSCHVGLNGKALDSSNSIAEFDAEWLWVKDTKDGEEATIKIDAPGRRILNVWMRENGFILDKILLTQDPKYMPSGKGP